MYPKVCRLPDCIPHGVIPSAVSGLQSSQAARAGPLGELPAAHLLNIEKLKQRLGFRVPLKNFVLVCVR